MPDKNDAKVSWSNRELGYIGFFERTLNTKVIDCIIADDDKTIFFLVNPEDAERIRHNCRILLQHFTKTVGKDVQIVEFHDDLKVFLRRALYPAKVLEIQVGNGAKGGKIAHITVSEMDKGKAIGRNGFRIQGIREIVKRHFGLADVKIR